MNCPNCKTDSTKVLRTVKLTKETIRVRWCAVCKKAFNTIEKVDYTE